MATTTTRRIAGASIAMLGVLGLAACNNNDVSAATPPATNSPATQSPDTATQSPSTSETTTEETTSAPSTSEPSATTSKSDSEAGDPGKVTGPTKPTDKNAKLKFGDQAVIVDDSKGTYRIKVNDLKVAPKSVYKTANLNESNGTVYFLDFDVTPIKQPAGKDYSFTTSSVNGLFLHPTFQSGAKAKRLYGDAPGCKSEYTKLSIGQSGASCYIYQIDGPKLSGVTFNDYQHNITWTK